LKSAIEKHSACCVPVRIHLYFNVFLKLSAQKQSSFIAASTVVLQFALNPIRFIQTLPEGRNVITAPTIVDAQPPSNSHKVLFVGAPVKMRETSELAESDALIP
jgi:hypothetical protein